MGLPEIAGLLAVGVAAGMAGGLVGVGGGVLMVPGLVIFLDETQLAAQATSLLAIVLVCAVGAWRQHGYGNLRPRDALVLGVLSPVGVVIGAVLANAVPERALELSFGALQLVVAFQLARRALRQGAPDAASG